MWRESLAWHGCLGIKLLFIHGGPQFVVPLLLSEGREELDDDLNTQMVGRHVHRDALTDRQFVWTKVENVSPLHVEHGMGLDAQQLDGCIFRT